jgi:AcrR family transcriptional regulator
MNKRPTRRYESPLREEHVEQTRERVLGALVELIADEGLDGVTIAAAARRASVGVATVYRHFGTRDALLDAFYEWVDRRYGGPEYPATVEELLALVPRLFAAFDENEPLIRASLAGAGLEVRRRDRERRFGERWRAIEEASAAADLSPEAERALRAIVRLLVSSEVWRALRDESRLTGAEGGRLVAWLLRLVFAELQQNPGSLEKETTA